MSSFGLFPEGLVIPLVADVRDEFEEGIRDEFGRSLPLGDGTFLGFLIGILSERLGIGYEILNQIYGAMDPNKAVDDLLRVVCSLTGTFETPSSTSTVTETLCGDDGTLVPAGKVISTASTGKRFTTFADATIAALAAWIPATNYTTGDRVTNLGACFICTTTGISDVAGGPAKPDPTDTIIVDNTARWQWFGDGAGAIDVVCTSEDIGPVVAAARDLSSIETPVDGWITAINLADALLGRDPMTNQQLRLLREAELTSQGKGPPDAIRAALIGINGVTGVKVFFNNTSLVNSDGLPPNSCECLVQGGADQDIIDVLWDNVPIGIETIGTTPGFATDAEGNLEAVNFSRPVERDIYVIVDLVKDPATYGGDAAVQAAIVAWGQLQRPGKDAVASAIGAQAFSVPGLLDVTSVKIGLAPAPGTSVTVAIAPRELAVYAVGRIVVNVTNGTP